MKKDPASFRDVDGYVFEYQGTVYRAVNECYLATYAKLKSTGFYDALLEEELIIPHEEEKELALHILHHPLIIRPLQINPISYPYEWSFEQYKDAALCTLKIQELALLYGFNLKDATPFNIQFVDGKPKLIDTLSFFTGDENVWIAYRQFCESFLAPLALMAYSDHDLVRACQVYHDGIPLMLASRMLPHRTWFKPSLCIHIHLHARAQASGGSHRRHDPAGTDRQKRLVYTLQRAVQSLPKSKSF
ncbi:MAG: hypothetical protein JXA06_02435, partial [Bacteroidetes bacterium]|nr:hypothetical protein [Bacteroidota bacterium]